MRRLVAMLCFGGGSDVAGSGENIGGDVSVSRPNIPTAGYAHMFLVISFPKTRGSGNGGVAW
jgi:hypothetical protein